MKNFIGRRIFLVEIHIKKNVFMKFPLNLIIPLFFLIKQIYMIWIQIIYLFHVTFNNVFLGLHCKNKAFKSGKVRGCNNLILFIFHPIHFVLDLNITELKYELLQGLANGEIARSFSLKYM